MRAIVYPKRLQALRDFFVLPKGCKSDVLDRAILFQHWQKSSTPAAGLLDEFFVNYSRKRYCARRRNRVTDQRDVEVEFHFYPFASHFLGLAETGRDVYGMRFERRMPYKMRVISAD